MLPINQSCTGGRGERFSGPQHPVARCEIYDYAAGMAARLAIDWPSDIRQVARTAQTGALGYADGIAAGRPALRGFSTS
jgi:hypothetical protein